MLSDSGKSLLVTSRYRPAAVIYRYGATLIADCELRPGKVVTVSVAYTRGITGHTRLCKQVFFGVVIGSFSLGNALPEIQTFATALGSATAVFAVIDRVR